MTKPDFPPGGGRYRSVTFVTSCSKLPSRDDYHVRPYPRIIFFDDNYARTGSASRNPLRAARDYIM